MALGKAVVSTTVGAEGLEVAPERDLLLGDTAERFPEQLVRALENDALPARLGAAGRARVCARYDWSAAVARLDAFYGELGAPSPPGPLSPAGREERSGRCASTAWDRGSAYLHGRYWSGFLVDGQVLLDCPPQTLVHLFKLGVASSAIELVLLTHAHSDHIGGMDLLLLDMKRTHAERSAPPLVGAPPGVYERLRAIVGTSTRLPERGDAALDWHELHDGDALERGPWRVECVKLEHDAELVALDYRVRAAGGAVLAYTGDTRDCAAMDRLVAGAGLLIAECATDRASGHFEWNDLRRCARGCPQRHACW